MEILHKSIRIIDYENKRVETRELPTAFDTYLNELIDYIEDNSAVREYKTRSNRTEVISSALSIINEVDDEQLVSNNIDVIARRLLDKEIIAQEKISQMNVNVRKGSLIVALLRIDNVYKFLLAKVQHHNFIDDTDYSIKTGFEKDKKALWKSCLYDISDMNSETYYAKVYVDCRAVFWNSEFLELDCVTNDEDNTRKAFGYIERCLNRNLKNSYPRDYTIIRNAVVWYLKNNVHIDYNQMVNNILLNYEAFSMTSEEVDDFRNKLLDNDKRKFDSQFNCVPQTINARIKKIYDVYDGIELRIKDGIQNIEDIIYSYTTAAGENLICIKTNNTEMLEYFKRD